SSRKSGLTSKNTSEKYYQIAILFLRHFCPVLVSIDYIIIKHEVENEQLLIGIARFLYVSG
ncbi:hypothetical protein ACQRD4_07920, partial [Streptococcus hyointestinalis]